ncbi:hypothetical protein [Haematospirillum sp. H4485]|uniref:hypothetical protein n=2 Tax=unclassified Haematospirillum TaxID=2622088 RepID=UPI00143B7E27|nr:hypothetical protein [Haematospirillum sp. H4485]NKD75247.1 hypothetical protein [Haematospirillum sp. H4485]
MGDASEKRMGGRAADPAQALGFSHAMREHHREKLPFGVSTHHPEAVMAAGGGRLKTRDALSTVRQSSGLISLAGIVFAALPPKGGMRRTESGHKKTAFNSVRPSAVECTWRSLGSNADVIETAWGMQAKNGWVGGLLTQRRRSVSVMRCVNIIEKNSPSAYRRTIQRPQWPLVAGGKKPEMHWH